MIISWFALQQWWSQCWSVGGYIWHEESCLPGEEFSTGWGWITLFQVKDDIDDRCRLLFHLGKCRHYQESLLTTEPFESQRRGVKCRSNWFCGLACNWLTSCRSHFWVYHLLEAIFLKCFQLPDGELLSNVCQLRNMLMGMLPWFTIIINYQQLLIFIAHRCWLTIHWYKSLLTKIRIVNHLIRKLVWTIPPNIHQHDQK